MKLLRRTMTTGGMLTPRLHVPRQVWFQSGAKFIAIESKFAACEELFLALQTCRRGVYGDFVSGLYQSESANGGIRNLDGNAVNRVLDEFDPIVETVRRDLAKKLRYLELDGNKNTGGRTLQKWGSLLTRSFSSIGSKKAEKVADLSAYIELLSRLFNLCEMLEDWMTHFERTKSFESNLVVDRLGKVSQFFESTILVFIVKDFEILMERYLKKMGQIALLPV
ncbi:hypothetical protein DFJ73DRAFT_623699 [Zopfochytrium polystomum]|nr:hypothetical protein DFJ73DRAFT_623699 [Zopfochytrium polystomum]